jgi:hypothetical protein
MSHELHYTSVARGLKPGTRGFGTVAATANLPETLAERLEGLSAYRAVYPPGDPSAALNPVAYVHVRLTVGNHPVDALSRIGPAGLDYSGRPNKYAHHVVLEPPERPEGGPAWLLSQPGFLRDAWEGEPRILPGGPPVPRGDRPASIAQSWLALTGDAGWAGVLAESFLADPRRPVFLVYRPGTELLPLFVEAIALLPASRRWDVEFSTYLTNLPPGVSCTWRGVLEGSAEAKNARRLPNALILDLCRPAGRAQGGALVHLARTGERLDIPDDGVPAVSSGRLGSRRPSSVSAGPPPHPRTSGRGDHPPDAHGEGDGLSDLAARLGLDVSPLGDDRPRRRRRSRTQRAALAIAACLVPLFALAFYASPTFRRQLGLDRGASRPSAMNPGSPLAAQPDSALRVAARDEGPRLPNGPAPAGGPAEPSPTEATAGKAPGPGGEPPVEKKPEAKADAPPEVHPKPDRPLAEPRIVTFRPPDVPRSSFSPAQQDRVLQLPEEAEGRIELRNGAGFRLNAVRAASPTWEFATRTGSVVGGGSSLARLSRVDARTWRFDWTEKAKTQSSQVVESLKDAILEFFGARDGRPIYVLLRGLDRRVERPLPVWTN